MREKELKSLSLRADAKPLALSPAGCEVLDRLRSGCAYQVRGVWRFRGSPAQASKATMSALLVKGLAECVETDRYIQVQITPFGLSLKRVFAK
jgi:hypothetical protein